jgi:archaeosine-15-forming tRNA-guanine transglycosylase
MAVKFLEQKISQKELQEIAEQGYGVVVKFAVDIDNEVMAVDRICSLN